MQALKQSSLRRLPAFSGLKPVPIHTHLLQRLNSRRLATASGTDMTSQQTCSPLWTRVLKVYDAAQASGAATKTETKVHMFEDSGIAFVLRIASALNSKPKGVASTSPQQFNQQQPAAVRNPFLPYEEELWVQHLSDSHTLLLNKFNVVPHHVLVVTRQFESQQDPLNARDLAATQQVLAAMPHGGVAFYNCGAFSGRSQPHKHLQIVPLPFNEQQSQAGVQAEPPVQQAVLAAQCAAGTQPLQPFPLRQFPFRAYAVAIQQSTTAEQLEAAVAQLLALCQAGLPEPVSYNAVLTREYVLMVPRSKETSGPIAINSLGFAGTILLRSEDDLRYAIEQKPLNILTGVGHPWSTEPEDKM